MFSQSFRSISNRLHYFIQSNFLKHVIAVYYLMRKVVLERIPALLLFFVQRIGGSSSI